MAKYRNGFYNEMINKHPSKYNREDESQNLDDVDDECLCDECYEKKHGYPRNELKNILNNDTTREYFLYQADSSFMFRYNEETEKICLIASETGNFDDPGIAVETDMCTLLDLLNYEIDEIQSTRDISINHYIKIVDQFIVVMDLDTNQSFSFTFDAVQDFVYGCLRAEYLLD